MASYVLLMNLSGPLAPALLQRRRMCRKSIAQFAWSWPTSLMQILPVACVFCTAAACPKVMRAISYARTILMACWWAARASTQDTFWLSVSRLLSMRQPDSLHLNALLFRDSLNQVKNLFV